MRTPGKNRKEDTLKDVSEKAKHTAVNKIAHLLSKNKDEIPEGITREQLKQEVLSHNLDNMIVEIEVADAPKPMEIVPGSGTEINIGNIFGDMFPKKTKKRQVTVKEALEILTNEEADRLHSMQFPVLCEETKEKMQEAVYRGREG